MKTLLLILVSISTFGQCPYAYPQIVCMDGKMNGYPAGVLCPYIAGQATGAIYKWTWTGTPELVGTNTRTLTTNTPGVYTLTIKSPGIDPNCNTVSTHTVSACTGVGEVSGNEPQPSYFDLSGKPSNEKNVILIEQRGNVRRKVVVIE